MSAFPDTSFLCALYRRQANAPLAIAYMAQHAAPLPVSSFLLLEFRQSLRLQARLHAHDRTKGFPATEGHLMLRLLQTDLATHVLQTASVDWSDVHQRAEHLSARYTEAHGHRLADILHVATALHLGAEAFLTFDAHQRRLATAEGLKLAV